MKLGSIIRLYRTKRCFSQERLAQLANIDAKYYGKVERGESSPTINTVFKICDALEISLLELLLYATETHLPPQNKYKINVMPPINQATFKREFPFLGVCKKVCKFIFFCGRF